MARDVHNGKNEFNIDKDNNGGSDNNDNKDECAFKISMRIKIIMTRVRILNFFLQIIIL